MIPIKNLHNRNMPWRGFEPPRLTALVPKTSMSTVPSPGLPYNEIIA